MLRCFVRLRWARLPLTGQIEREIGRVTLTSASARESPCLCSALPVLR